MKIKIIEIAKYYDLDIDEIYYDDELKCIVDKKDNVYWD